jgi:hypothetical protein
VGAVKDDKPVLWIFEDEHAGITYSVVMWGNHDFASMDEARNHVAASCHIPAARLTMVYQLDPAQVMSSNNIEVKNRSRTKVFG